MGRETSYHKSLKPTMQLPTPIPQEGLGHQFVGDIYDCSGPLEDPNFVRDAVLEAAKLANATVLKEVTHEFSPHGISSVLVIAESHIAIHTWPEHNYMAVDMFTCNHTVDGEKLVNYLKMKVGSENVKFQHVRRGLPQPQKELCSAKQN